MSRYTEQINSLGSDRTQINSALSDKLSDSVDVKFSEMPDKIREIEVSSGGKYKIIVDFGDHYGGDYKHRISIAIDENSFLSGKRVLNINETKNPSTQGQYEYSFETDADTIVLSISVYYYTSSPYDIEMPPKTLTDLKSHKTIKMVPGTTSGAISIQYAD